MNVKDFLEEMKKIQTSLIDLLEHGDDIEERYQNLINIFEDIKIHDNQYKIKPLLYLISKISDNHYRESNFFNKIEMILKLFKDDMKRYFSKNELFDIFKRNKRLLLFLLEENMIIMDESIVQIIINNTKFIEAKYPQYFQPEIQPFINKDFFPKYEKDNWSLQKNKWVEDLKKELPDDFYSKRKIGENDDEICKIIQKDSIEEFIIYVNKNDCPANSIIKSSIYETNNFLIENQNITLIEYAVFFGSIQIFNYLSKNGAELKLSLWLYAVHGKNPEIIDFLKENKILQTKNIEKKDDIEEEEEEEENDDDDDDDSDDLITFEEVYKESIKCHHIDVSNYIQNNYFQNEKDLSIDILISSLKYYNFVLIRSDIENGTSFYYLCKYDYYLLVFILCENIDIDINKKIICMVIF